MANAQPEPSMEEILASIRRIISDDEVDGETAVADQTDQDSGTFSEQESRELNTEPVTQLSRSEALGADAIPLRPQAVDTSDTFAQTNASDEMVDERATYLETPSPSATSPQEASVELVKADQEQGASPTEGETGSALFSTPESNASEIDGLAAGESSALTESALNSTSLSAKTPEAELAAFSAASTEGIVGNASASVASEAFRSLSQSIRVSGQGDKTLEDIVVGLLTPLIKDWLDQNLPAIVEEKVQDEVQRIARRAR
ncbi:MAG: DUF2497 domain-containing protein [Pseudomonadota bacterium]